MVALVHVVALVQAQINDGEFAAKSALEGKCMLCIVWCVSQSIIIELIDRQKK